MATTTTKRVGSLTVTFAIELDPNSEKGEYAESYLTNEDKANNFLSFAINNLVEMANDGSDGSFILVRVES